MTSIRSAVPALVVADVVLTMAGGRRLVRVDEAEIVSRGGAAGGQRVLRSFVVFFVHVAGTWAGRVSSRYGAGFLQARLEADGLHAPAGEMEAPAP